MATRYKRGSDRHVRQTIARIKSLRFHKYYRKATPSDRSHERFVQLDFDSEDLNALVDLLERLEAGLAKVKDLSLPTGG